jgi:hypothetical protein
MVGQATHAGIVPHLKENLSVVEGIFDCYYDHVDSEIPGNSPVLRVASNKGLQFVNPEIYQ